MQVILLEQLKKLGGIGDVVSVKSGYARNFLIPNKKALRATEDNVAYFESKRAEIEKENKANAAAARKIAAKINGAVIPLIQQAGDDGRLYGAVHASDIAKAAGAETTEAVDRKQVVLNRPIKYIGIHTIEITLHAEVSAMLHVNVARGDDEAADAAARFARGEIVMEGPEGEAAREKAAKTVQTLAQEVFAEAPMELPDGGLADGQSAQVPPGEESTDAASAKKKPSKKKDAE